MKDLITISIAGVLLWWVMMWPMESRADVLFDDNRIMIYVKVFSF